MSNHTLCDILNCEQPANSFNVEYLDVQIVPTGNSDYSATEEKHIRRSNFDLCEKHEVEYDKRVAKVLVKDKKGLYFPK